MASKLFRSLVLLILLVSQSQLSAARQVDAATDPGHLLRVAVGRWLDVIEPPVGTPPQTLSLRAKLVRGAGFPGEATNATVDLNYQYPDRLRAMALVAGEEIRFARDGQQLWVHQPTKKFGVVGKTGVVRFTADASTIDQTVLPPFELPYSHFRIKAFLLLLHAEHLGQEKVAGSDCDLLKVTPKAASLLGVENLVLRVWIRQGDLMPMRVAATDGGSLDVQVDLADVSLGAPVAADAWKMKPNDGDKIETVALSHLAKALEVGPRIMNQEIPVLGVATGRRQLIAKSGKGRLETLDGTRILFLRGSPEEMGQQHGQLLKAEIHDVSEKILYGIGVGSSFAKGNWFFGEIESAQNRITPFIDPRVLREMDALAVASGMHKQESRLANFFPELFHCSGFALLGKATKDGHVYHGRVLDYLRGVGLEQNAVVMVYQPDDGRNAWVNLSYAGFVGSVTAMNEKGISIGEMGGRGSGQWDGKPMAQLVREVMEKANTLDEAVAIMKAGPRTCEYYYVIADGKTKQAVGIGATPTTFEIVKPGEAHAKLPHPVEDTVLLSAGDRYELLSKRVKEKWGQFDADTARELMTRPVCMTSNIQSVLFVPDTLDFYVANADGKNVASHTRFTKYNLGELLRSVPPAGGF